jgi:hypothetical protein
MSRHSKTYYRKFRDGEEHRFTKDLIHNQIPSFYQQDGPQLIKLLEEYYNFLHVDGGPEAVGKNIIKLNDIDELGDFYNQYLEDSGAKLTPTENLITGGNFPKDSIQSIGSSLKFANFNRVHYSGDGDNSNSLGTSQDFTNPFQAGLVVGKTYNINFVEKGGPSNYIVSVPRVFKGAFVFDSNGVESNVPTDADFDLDEFAIIELKNFTTYGSEDFNLQVGWGGPDGTSLNNKNPDNWFQGPDNGNFDDGTLITITEVIDDTSSANASITTSATTLLTNVENLYKSNYLLNFPTNMVSFEHLVKNVLSIYRAKGSERAFETLMRGIYNVDTLIQYPFDRTLKASDGVFGYDAYIQTIFDNEILDFKDTVIVGAESGAIGYVEDIVIRVVKGKIIAQLILSKQGLTGIFRHDEEISSRGSSTFTSRIIAGMREIQLTSNGANYQVGDKANIIGNGLGGVAQITEVDSFAGRVKFTLDNGGSGYKLGDDINVVGPTSGSTAQARIGSLKDIETINISLDRVGALAANSQITLNEGPSFHSNSFINAVSTFTNPPIAGPALASGVRANWIASSNDVHLSTSIANNTIVNGAIITIGNTSIIHNEQMKVHDFFPGNNTIRFTSQTAFAAPNTAAHVRIYAANTTYRLSANMAGANISSKINASFADSAQQFGSISTLITTDAGSGYDIPPVATVENADASSLSIADGSGGFKGRNAVISTEIVRDSTITKLIVNDHGLGYTNTNITLSNPRGGATATGTFVIGGTGNSAPAYKDVKGFLSENQRIQDSFFYQAFSYESITNRSFDEYETTMISLTHPAGSRLFGKFRTEAIAQATPIMIVDITQSITAPDNKSAAILGLGALGTTRLNETAF